MKELFLYREPSTKMDTPGVLAFDNEMVCYTLEDLDRELHSGMTRKEVLAIKVYGSTAIPYGRYEFIWYDSTRHGRVPMLLSVTGFSYIQIHSANWAHQLLGCIAPGIVRGTNAVYQSVAACEKVYKLIQQNQIKYINIEKMK